MTADGNVFRYPCPGSWIAPRYFRIIVALLVSFAVGLFLIIFGFYGILNGKWAQVAFGLFGGLGFIGLGVYAFHASICGFSGGTLKGYSRPEGLGEVRLGAPVFWALIDVLATACLSVSGIFFSVGVWCDLFQPVLTPGQRVFLPIVSIVLAMGSMYGAIFRLSRMFKGTVVLTPSGISVASSVNTKTLKWIEISSITPESGRARKQTRSAILIRRQSGSSVTVLADELEIGAVAAFWLIDFYWRNLEARSELSDGRAIARLQDGSLAEEVQRYVNSRA